MGDVVIKRLNEVDDITNTDNIDVNLIYAPKQRIISDIVNKSQHIKIPTMAIHYTDITFEDSRAFNKIEGFTLSNKYLSGGGNFPQPVPVTLNMNLSIFGRYQRDIDQIITCIFSNFFPYIFVSYEHPDTNHEVRCCLMWDKTIRMETPLDIDGTKPYRIIANASFKVHGWIFRNAYNNSGIIYNIPTTFTSVSNIIDDYDYLRAFESSVTTDYFTISGRPQLNIINPYTLGVGNSETFHIQGDMFNLLTGLYVSATSNIYPLSSYKFYNFFATNSALSAQYTGFSAVSVDTANWSIIDNNNLTFTLPTPSTTGFIDVIGYSFIGYGKLTEDSIRTTFNPYPTASPQYLTYTTLQWPFSSGIHVLP